MSKDEDDKLDKILEEIARMNRGLYGDPVNKVPGLMQSHFDLEKKVDRIDEFKKKATWTVGGITVAMPFIVQEVRKYLGI